MYALTRSAQILFQRKAVIHTFTLVLAFFMSYTVRLYGKKSKRVGQVAQNVRLAPATIYCHFQYTACCTLLSTHQVLYTACCALAVNPPGIVHGMLCTGCALAVNPPGTVHSMLYTGCQPTRYCTQHAAHCCQPTRYCTQHAVHWLCTGCQPTRYCTRHAGHWLSTLDAPWL